MERLGMDRVMMDFCWAASSMVEQLTLNQRVGGSSPPRLTITFNQSQRSAKSPTSPLWRKI
jgi:hypothetical protein